MAAQAARTVWEAFTHPLTEEQFVAWYVKHDAAKNKRKNEGPAETAPAKAAKKSDGGTTTPATLPKAKRTALLKALGSSLKQSVKGKKTKWHQGDYATLPGSAVMDSGDFASLFPGLYL